jgi:hypothetical protein
MMMTMMMTFKQKIVINTKNDMEPTHTLKKKTVALFIKAGGTYTYRSA